MLVATRAQLIVSVAAVPSEPLNVKAAAVTSQPTGSVRVSWSRPLQTNGVIVAYHVHYSRAQSSTPVAEWPAVREDGMSSHSLLQCVHQSWILV